MSVTVMPSPLATRWHRSSPVARAALVAGVAWFPLVLLNIAAGTLLSAELNLPFAHDLTAHVRLLVVLPMYLLVSRFIEPELRNIVRELRRRRIVTDAAFYRTLVRSLEHRLTSPRALTVIAILALARGVIAAGMDNPDSWIKTDAGFHLTAAGWWYAAVALPILFFVSGRWIWAVLLWSYYLARVSRMRLELVPTHPDGAGGIGFIGLGHSRFAVIALAGSLGLSAKIAIAVIVMGHPLSRYHAAVAAIVVGQVGLLIAPMFAFTPRLLTLHREGALVYGRLGMGYVRAFEEKWLTSRRDPEAVLLGSADIQSLADLAGSYDVVQQSRSTPLSRKDLLKVLVMAAAPYLPLLLTEMSLGQLLGIARSVVG